VRGEDRRPLGSSGSSIRDTQQLVETLSGC